MGWRTPAVVLLVLGTVVGCVGRAERRDQVSVAPPPPARLLLLQRMARARAVMSELRWTAASLEFARMGELARRIADDFREDEVMLTMPGPDRRPASERFRVFERELSERATDLALAARRGQGPVARATYRAMLETCLRCHAAFRVGPPLSLPTALR